MDDSIIDPIQQSFADTPWLSTPGADGVSIHTGFPNAAADVRLKSLDLNQLLIAHPTSTFMFRVRGEQGNDRGVFDGDIAVVDRLADPQANDFVLWHDGQQFNLSRASRIAAGRTTWGVVTAVIHQYHAKN